MVKVEYYFESDEMTDDEYNEQEREFIITKEMIIELIMEHVEIPEGMEIDYENIYANLNQ